MGYVEIPDQVPQNGGKLLTTLVLDKLELQTTVSLLKDALAELTSGMQNGFSSSSSNKVAPSPAAPPAGALPVPRPGANAAATATHARPPAPLAARPPQQQQQPVQAPPNQQQQQYTRPPQVPVTPPGIVPVAQPVAAQPRPAPAPQQQQQQPPPRQQPQPPPQQQQQQWPSLAQQAPPPAAQQPPPARAGAATLTPAPASGLWRQCFTTDPNDHANSTVAALAYARAMPGLAGGDGHPGWLVSSSKGTLNLWETSRAVPGEEVLLMMHSQGVDFTATKLVLEPATKLMLGASLASGHTASEFVSVHSLDLEVGLLAYRYKYGPPKAGEQRERKMQQVVSLHNLNAGVRNTIMASYGDRLLLFSTKDAYKVPAGSLLTQSNLHFVAHPGSTITALQTSQGLEGVQNLISGAADGKIHIWDMAQPPADNKPAMRLYRHTGMVTGLAQVTDERLVSSSMDGSVMLWDLRHTSGPLFTQRAPGNAGVLRIAPGPWGDMLAVSTAKGLHAVELFDFEAPMANVAAFPLQRPYVDLVFNTVTHDLYAATTSGAIAVFSRKG